MCVYVCIDISHLLLTSFNKLLTFKTILHLYTSERLGWETRAGFIFCNSHVLLLRLKQKSNKDIKSRCKGKITEDMHKINNNAN